MSTLLFVSSTNLLDVLRTASPKADGEPNRVFWHAQVKLDELSRITAQFDRLIDFWCDSPVLVGMAAQRLSPWAAAPRRNDDKAVAFAKPGDLVLVLPSTGTHWRSLLHWEDRVALGKHLDEQPVPVVFIGETLPDEILRASPPVSWTRTPVCPDECLLELMERNSAQEFFFPDSMKSFAAHFFPGRDRVTVGELIGYRDNPELRFKVGGKLRFQLPDVTDMTGRTKAWAALESAVEGD